MADSSIVAAVDYARTCTISSQHDADKQLLDLAMRYLKGRANPAEVLKEIRSRYIVEI